MISVIVPSTGIRLIDNEHKDLAEIVEKILKENMKYVELVEYYQVLADEVMIHFEHEQELMIDYKYPRQCYLKHEKDHTHKTIEILWLKNNLKNIGNNREYHAEQMSRLVKWLVYHISIEDVNLGKFLVSKGLQ